jgi:hypothetical protein
MSRGCVVRITMVAAAVSGFGATNVAAGPSAWVQVSVNLPLQEVQAALEAAIPAKIERLGATEFDGGWGFRYGAWRGPISVSGRGGALHISARIEFAAWVCKRISKPLPLRGEICEPVASCGYGNEPHPIVDISTTVTAAWTADWSVAASANMWSTTIRPCRVTLANIDMTQRATGVLSARIQEQAAKIGERLHLRTAAERAWSNITPVRLGNDAWAVLQPNSIQVGPILVQPFEVTTSAQIGVTTSVAISMTPPAMPPLPASLPLTLRP